MKLVEINIHPEGVEIAITGLINSIFADKSISIDNCTNLWDMCEQLGSRKVCIIKK